MTQSSLGSVLEMGGNCKLGREALGSSCGIKRIDGSCLWGVDASVTASEPWWETPKEGAADSARVRVIDAGRGDVAEVVEGSAEDATRDRPLRPTTVGTQPLVAPGVSAAALTGAWRECEGRSALGVVSVLEEESEVFALGVDRVRTSEGRRMWPLLPAEDRSLEEWRWV